MKYLMKKIGDLYIFLNNKFDKISDKIYETTGNRINVGFIVLITFLAIITFFVVKGLLRWIFSLI